MNTRDVGSVSMYVILKPLWKMNLNEYLLRHGNATKIQVHTTISIDIGRNNGIRTRHHLSLQTCIDSKATPITTDAVTDAVYV